MEDSHDVFTQVEGEAREDVRPSTAASEEEEETNAEKVGDVSTAHDVAVSSSSPSGNRTGSTAATPGPRGRKRATDATASSACLHIKRRSSRQRQRRGLKRSRNSEANNRTTARCPPPLEYQHAALSRSSSSSRSKLRPKLLSKTVREKQTTTINATAVAEAAAVAARIAMTVTRRTLRISPMLLACHPCHRPMSLRPLPRPLRRSQPHP